jgi:REP element-mobilizing transposase RayT
MSYRGVELAIGEWFHCYTRTIDRSRIFSNVDLAERFLETIYLANQDSSLPIIAKLRRDCTHEEIFSIERRAPLVAIASYSIMPTHYHLLIQALVENGLSEFMHKVGTSFTRFYNEQHQRAGNLFIKPFRAKHISDDSYFFHIPNYIHLNAAEIFEPRWKGGYVQNMATLENRLREYPFASLRDYKGIQRPQRNILDENSIRLFSEHVPSLQNCIKEAMEYYRFLEFDL